MDDSSFFKYNFLCETFPWRRRVHDGGVRGNYALRRGYMKPNLINTFTLRINGVETCNYTNYDRGKGARFTGEIIKGTVHESFKIVQ